MVFPAIVTACSQVEVVGCIVQNYIKGDNCTTSQLSLGLAQNNMTRTILIPPGLFFLGKHMKGKIGQLFCWYSRIQVLFNSCTHAVFSCSVSFDWICFTRNVSETLRDSIYQLSIVTVMLRSKQHRTSVAYGNEYIFIQPKSLWISDLDWEVFLVQAGCMHSGCELQIGVPRKTRQLNSVLHACQIL